MPISTISTTNSNRQCSWAKAHHHKGKTFFSISRDVRSRMGDTFIAEVLQPRFKTRPPPWITFTQWAWRVLSSALYHRLNDDTLYYLARRADRSATYTTDKLGGRQKSATNKSAGCFDATMRQVSRLCIQSMNL